MTDGVLTEETDAPPSSMRHDVEMILVKITRDRPDYLTIGPGKMAALTAIIADEMRQRFGSQYLTRVEDRTERNKAAMKMFNGKNREEVMKRFRISKRVFYRILSDHLRSRRK